MNEQRRALNIQTRIVDEEKGIVEYVASDEAVDSYGDIIRAKGWRFNLFKKNAPFVDSHDYSTIKKLVGSVLSFRVHGKNLIERVQWAVAVPDNELARIGFKMTVAGHLKAVSVGFVPKRWVSRYSEDQKLWNEQLEDLGLDRDSAPGGVIFIEQEQLELSSCIIGANPNALAKAYKADVVSEGDLDALARISQEHAWREAYGPAAPPGEDLAARARTDLERRRFLQIVDDAIKRIS